MFVIQRMFIEDKNLHKVLIAVAGLVVNMDAPQPVVNATLKKGQIVQSGGDTVYARLANLISSKLVKGAIFTSENLKGMVKDVGGNPASSGSYRAQLTENKIIKIKSKGNYVVL